MTHLVCGVVGLSGIREQILLMGLWDRMDSTRIYKALEENSKETINFCRLKRGLAEVVATFQSVIKVDQRNGLDQHKYPLDEDEKPTKVSKN